MTNLYCYKNLLYSRAKKLSRIKYRLLCFELFLLFILVYATGDLFVTILLLGVVVIHICAEYTKYVAKRSNMLGFKFDKIIRLKNSYGEIPSNFELSDLKSESIFFYKKLKECLCQKEPDEDDYNIKNTSTHEKELLSRLQEDAFWNHHQYQKMFIRKKRSFIIQLVVIPLIILIFVFLIFFEYHKLNYSFQPIKLVFVFLSFGLLYEFVDEMMDYYRASIEMNEIDNEITRLYEKDNPTQNAMALMVKFHFVRAMCPNIDDDIYITYKDGLNKAWNLRVSKSLNRAFDILVKKLANTEEKWALTGGMNLYLRKQKENTKDIDIITTKEGIAELAKRLGIKINRLEYKEIKNLRSYFIQHVIEGVCVDIMANPEFRLNGKWKSLNWQDEIVDFLVGDKSIKTTSLDYEKLTQTVICKQRINKSIERKEDL